MTIDCHEHVSPPEELWAYKSHILFHRSSNGRRKATVADDKLIFLASKKEMASAGYLDMLDCHGTDMQFISPRFSQVKRSGRPVHWLCAEANSITDCQVSLFQSRFFAAAMRLGQTLLDGMRKLSYDTVRYSEGALHLLIELVGLNRYLFVVECHGVRSVVSPTTSLIVYDMRSVIG